MLLDHRCFSALLTRKIYHFTFGSHLFSFDIFIGAYYLIYFSFEALSKSFFL